jgi:hypothetical protein
MPVFLRITIVKKKMKGSEDKLEPGLELDEEQLKTTNGVF